MRQGGVWVVALVAGMSGLLLLSPSVFAAEHGGKEHAGTATKEHGGTAAPQAKEHGGLPAAPSAAQAGTTQEHGGQAVQAEPSAEQIRQAIGDHIGLVEEEEGAFTIEDDVTGATRTLTLVRVHERVGKTGELYYSCTDMRDASTGELLDLDFDVEASEGQLEVVDARIHKVNDQARYTYDEEDNRIPVISKSSESTQGRERTY